MTVERQVLDRARGNAEFGEKTLTLCVFIDAFGWELYRQHASFLSGLITHASPLETVFGYSCTCDPTILTGKLPREHGHFSFFRYAPEQSPFRRSNSAIRLASSLPASVTRRGRVRRGISRMVGQTLGYTGYFQLYNMPFYLLPLFDYTEKRDLYRPGGINAGLPTVFDRLRENGIRYYCSDWRAREETNLTALQDVLTEPAHRRPEFAYLYLAAMDGLLHAEGPNSDSIAEKLHWYDCQIRNTVSLAEGRYGSVRLHLFSDHGMTEVTATCDLMARIARLGLRFGTDYAAVYDSTMARFWLLSGRAGRLIPKTLAEEPSGRILTEACLREWGCDFPDNRYGDLFFLLDPGVLLCPSFMGETRLAGMHGYDPTHVDSIALYVTNTSDVPRPHALTDLYGLMCSEAGLSLATEIEAARDNRDFSRLVAAR